MKKNIFISLLLALLPLAGMAQQKKPIAKAAPSTNKQLMGKLEKIDSLLEENCDLLDAIEINTSLKYRYKLYPTENIYNFLELDTQTGRINQVQWSMDSANECYIPIIPFDLVSEDEGYGSNSFDLYPTKNIYTFILIDKTTGRMWHVQWGMDRTKRLFKEIKKLY